VLERHLSKTILNAPVDGVVSVVVAEIGENVHAGQPVIAIEASGEQWLSFNAREDFLNGLTVGTTVEVTCAGTPQRMPAVVTELRPLGAFAAWQAERAIGDHDRNTLRLRLDPRGEAPGFEPGMTVWIARSGDKEERSGDPRPMAHSLSSLWQGLQNMLKKLAFASSQ
jgi:HlyD family secretion protein